MVQPSEKTRHILWITERFPPLPGGMSVSCHRQVSGLRASDIRLDVVAFTEAGPGLEVREVARDNGTDLHVNREAPPGMVAQHVWHRVQSLGRPLPFTHVIGFGATRPGFLAGTFAAWLGVPSIVLVRGNDFDRDWFDPRLGAWVREGFQRATLIGAVAPETGTRIQALYPGREVRFTPNGVDVSAWTLLPADRKARDKHREELAPDGRPIIGVFGEIKHKKRFPLFLGALRDTGKQDEVALLVVGRLDEESAQILADPALAPRHRHVKFVERDRLAGLYAACDYIAMPSMYEGMPNVLLEAMAMGVIPLVSSAGAMGDVVEDGVTGFVFPPEDREAATRATLAALSQQPSEREAMGQRARARINSAFSIQKELDTLQHLLTLATGRKFEVRS